MKKEVLALIVGIIFLVAGYILGSFVPVNSFTGTALKSDIDTFAYAAGLSSGLQIIDFVEQQEYQDSFTESSFKNGVNDGMSRNEKIMTKMDAQMNLQSFIMKIQKSAQERAVKQAEENLQAGMQFLEDNRQREEVQVTESGLQYEILEEGSGPKPTEMDTVVVHYHGTLLDETVFDSSVDRGEPVTFPVNGVIPGWTEALQLMPEGSKWKLYIPSDLAYGPNPPGATIEPNSTLIFEVELIEVK